MIAVESPNGHSSSTTSVPTEGRFRVFCGVGYSPRPPLPLLASHTSATIKRPSCVRVFRASHLPLPHSVANTGAAPARIRNLEFLFRTKHQALRTSHWAALPPSALRRAGVHNLANRDNPLGSNSPPRSAATFHGVSYSTFPHFHQPTN